jgi:hypothetical protein
MDKLCATCGKQLQPDQGFCENCGSAWTPSAEAAPATAPNPISAAPQPVVPQAAAQTSDGRSSKTLLIVAIAVVALGIGGWLFLRGRAAADSPVVASSEDAASSKPCSAVTRAEMGKILGAKIVKVTNTELSCSYFTNEATFVDVDTTWTGGKDAFAQVKGFNSAPGLSEPVAGLGDEAYMQAAGVLHVLKGDTYVTVNSRLYPKDLETESAIARVVLEKLK